ncbi:hypothetical protein GQ53DRAFT_826630 [Thozetella sp. PMI_491]|nr:hypothetical protein GQ53DRAFT_826630 [Thozetella sp. PMI_491]
MVLDLSVVDPDGELLPPLEAYKVIDVNMKGNLNSEYTEQFCHGAILMSSLAGLKLALHHMQGRGGSVVLAASTSGYIGGTGVSAYIASKHGVVGLLQASKGTAQKYGVRLNGMAPFFVPTAFTTAYSNLWKDTGLEANTPGDVAAVIAQTTLNSTKNGTCILAASLHGKGA